ncbi:hypothetical protein EVAR_11005_1 [Eumeta japonica]|uniref:Uncharacterized protein n=1 Tax=Eumeta variegata TaxID=151549 RepID=A0A4C1YLB3_EUMVA|nr:hypothetical protein EVAR_11005_1 [Eumeta japonica]
MTCHSAKRGNYLFTDSSTLFTLVGHFLVSLYHGPYTVDVVFGRRRRTSLTQIVSQICANMSELVKRVINSGSFIMKDQPMVYQKRHFKSSIVRPTKPIRDDKAHQNKSPARNEMENVCLLSRISYVTNSTYIFYIAAHVEGNEYVTLTPSGVRVPLRDYSESKIPLSTMVRIALPNINLSNSFEENQLYQSPKSGILKVTFSIIHRVFSDFQKYLINGEVCRGSAPGQTAPAARFRERAFRRTAPLTARDGMRPKNKKRNIATFALLPRTSLWRVACDFILYVDHNLMLYLL